METLYIRARSVSSATKIELSNMTLGGQAVPDLLYQGAGSAGAGYLQISDFDFAQNWLLAGTVTLTWDTAAVPNNSALDVNFKLTDVVSAVPLPAAMWLMLAGLGGLVAVGRRKPA
jgi:hypothetical protein